MREFGGERVIRSLLSYSRNFSIKAILSTILYVIKQDTEQRVFETYTAECLRLISENTAKMSGGTFISVKYKDIINPPKKEKKTATEIVEDICLRSGIKVIE